MLNAILHLIASILINYNKQNNLGHSNCIKQKKVIQFAFCLQIETDLLKLVKHPFKLIKR